MATPTTNLRNKDEHNNPTHGGPTGMGAKKHEATGVMDKASDMASAAMEKVKDAGSSAADKARDFASTAADKARDAASTAADKARDVASTLGHKADDATSAVSGGMKNLAGTIRENLPHSGVLGSASSTLADTLDSSSRYLQEEGLKGMSEDLTNLIRRNPIPALFVGIGIGYLLARSTSRS